MMKLNKTTQRFKTFLVGTATLLTLLATTAIAAKADSTATTSAKTTVDEAAASSDKAATPAKQVVLHSSSTSSSASSESQTSSSSASSTSAVSQSNSSATASSASPGSRTASASSISSDTTDEVRASSSSSTPRNSKNNPAKVQAAAKSDDAETNNKQQLTRQYSPMTTSQKGSGSQAIAPKANLMKLSFSNLTALAAQAKLVVNGLTASDAVVTDSTGKQYSASDVLSLYAGYIATYHWSIDDGIAVKDGDTATLSLPDNVLFTANTTAVDVTNGAGQSIGTFSAQAGSQTGTLTFNDYFAVNNVSSRQGTLTFHVTGTDTTIGDSKAKINKVGWWLSDGKSIEWQIVANLGSEAWNNVTIVDQLGQYQTHNSEITFESGSYVDGAFVKAQSLGEYDLDTGVFTPTEGVSATAVTVAMNGNQMTIKLGDITTAINIFYSVAVEPGQVYTNNANANYTLPGTTDPGDGGTTNPGGGGSSDGGNTPDNSQNVNSSPSLAAGGSGSAEWYTYALFVTKTDKDTGVAIPNAVYELQTAAGVVLQSNLKTDQNGQLTIPNLAAGTYLLKETTAPEGYLLDKTTHEIVISSTAATVDGVNTYRVTEPVTDTAIATTSLTVKKVWKNAPATTPDVTVTLYLNDQPTTQTLTLTAGNGYQGSFDHLPVSDADSHTYKYTVKETPLTGYESSQTTADNTVTLTNTYRTITVVKTDEAGQKLLANATFTLTNTDGKVIATQKTDANGRVVFAGLVQGTYQVQETQAPAGYALDPATYAVTLDSQTNYQTVMVKDTEIKGSLILTKVDSATNAKLAGATFELRDANDQVVQTATTDANGQLTFKDLALGTYTLVEVTAPTGYHLNTKPQQIVISADATNQTRTVADDAIKGQLSLTKVDSATGAQLAGAIFELKDTSGNVVAKATTDAQGQLNFTGLDLGTYTLVEVTAPTGYQLSAEAQQVVISADATDQIRTVADDAIKGQLTLTKVDSETGAKLAGATFELKDAMGKVVATGMTDAQGQLSFTGLALGTYTLVETVAPTGYQLATATQSVVLALTNTFATVTVTNTVIPTEPETPTEPTTPTEPETPTEPTTPTEPETPTEPTTPTTPEQPVQPDRVMPSTTTPVISKTQVKPVAAAVTVKPAVAAKATPRETEPALPQTDESESVWLIVIGWLIFLLAGWFGIRRRRA